MPDPVVTGSPDTGNGSQATNNGNAVPNANAPGGDTSRVANGNEAAKKYTYDEDRSQYVDPSKLKHRFDEVAKRATAETERRLREEYGREVNSRDAKIRALAGVETPDAKTAERDEIRAALKEIFPELGELTPQILAQIKETLESANAMRDTVAKTWEKHALDIFSDIESRVSENIGGDLTDRQIKSLRRAYRDEAAACQWSRENDPSHDPSNDFLSKHERRDEKHIEQFVKDWMDDWFEPARRSANQQVVNRQRPVPRGGSGRPVIVNRQKPDLSKPGAFEDALLAARSEEGGGFGSR